MQIERHIFGNRTGYTTLACSPGVDKEACRRLESVAFSFGQTNDPRFAAGLATQPSFLVHELPGGRRCLTRVMAGGADDNGRPTLLLVSAILSRSDWDRKLLGNVSWLLDRRELWQWEGTNDLAAIQLSAGPPPRTLSPDRATRLLPLISEMERGFTAGRQTLVSAAEYGPAELASLEVLIPPAARAGVGIACGSLNARYPATVNAPSAFASGRLAAFCSGGLLGDLSPYARFLADAGLLSGSIPLEKIMTYGRFGTGGVTPAPTTSRPKAVSAGRRGFVASLAAVVVLCLVSSVTSYAVAHAQAQQAIRDLQSQLIKVRQDTDALQARTQSENEALQDAIGQANARSSRMAQEMNRSIDGRINAVSSTIHDLDKRLTKLEARGKEATGGASSRPAATTLRSRGVDNE